MIHQRVFCRPEACKPLHAYCMRSSQDSDTTFSGRRVPLACCRCIETERAADATFDIAASMVEIYNEAVVDLLAEGGKREVELAKCAGGFAVPDLTRVGARALLLKPLNPRPYSLG